MPKYRQLHTKIVDSFDFAEMPDDFTRVVWLLLIVVVDSEGRAIDNPAWLRSKMFPIREDVKLDHISKAIDWLFLRGMIVKYQSDGIKYFYLPKFKTYQSGTDKEGKSYLPEPIELLPTNSGVTPDLIRLNTIQYNADTNTDSSTIQAQPPDVPQKLNTPDFLEAWKKWQVFKKETKKKLTPSMIKGQFKMLEEFGPITGAAMLEQSIANGWTGIFPLKTNGNGHRPQTQQERNIENARLLLEKERSNGNLS